jgi:hypothetical protein
MVVTTGAEKFYDALDTDDDASAEEIEWQFKMLCGSFVADFG